MSRCSKGNLEKIKANILRILFDEAPKAISAPEIAEMEIRDKEFILKLLREMERKNLVKNVTNKFTRKSYWTMTDQAYKKYKELL
jgi:DNA-binding transcriptional regulator GbsR (MarR family)